MEVGVDVGEGGVGEEMETNISKLFGLLLYS